MILGITGGIGSGKSAATDYLEQLGITVVDADLCSRIVVQPGRDELNSITQHFGDEILLSNGQLNRAALRTIIFAQPAEKQWLENLLHPAIRSEIEMQLSQSASKYTVLSSPLLFETHQNKFCDKVCVIDVDEHTQIDRVTKRDRNETEQVKAIIASQIDRQDRLAKADFVVTNGGTLAELHQQLDSLHHAILETLSV